MSRKNSFFVGQPTGMSLLDHVYSLAVSNYLGLSYTLSKVKLDELAKSKKMDCFHGSNVSSSGSNRTIPQKMIQNLFMHSLGIHPRLAAIFIEVISKFNFKHKQWEIRLGTANIRRFPFIYENLVHRNQYLVRDLDKSTINVTLDLTNVPKDKTKSKEEFVCFSKFTNALRDLLVSGIFPKLQILNLDVYVNNSKSVSEWEENLKIWNNQEESSTYTRTSKVIPAHDFTSVIQGFVTSDIQILTQSPSDASLVTSILYPAKLVLVDKDSPLKLRSWTQVL